MPIFGGLFCDLHSQNAAGLGSIIIVIDSITINYVLDIIVIVNEKHKSPIIVIIILVEILRIA